MKNLFEGVVINPIIPIWIMAIICVVLLFFKKKGVWGYIRQILIILLLFAINLRIMVIDDNQQAFKPDLNASVLFVFDNTLSMLADDAGDGRTRLDAAKEDCAYIMDELNGASFGLVTFGNEVKLAGPFTKDGEFLKNTLKPIYPIESFYARGTTFNICKDYVVDIINRTKMKETETDEAQKIILFFVTDGENTSDEELESFKDLSKYVDGGAVLGYGTEEGGTMTYYNRYFGRHEDIHDRNFNKAISHMDPDNLKKIAKDIGIECINMEESADVDGILEDIKENVLVLDSDEKTLGYNDIYFYFAIPLILLFAIDFISFKRNKI